MQRKIESWSLLTLDRDREVIDLTPDFQRRAVWSIDKKQLLIDSILRDLDIPKIYLRLLEQKTPAYEVIDGQQRIRAICEFCDGKFALSKNALPVGEYNVAGLTYRALPRELRRRIDTYNVSMVVIEDATDLEIRDFFIRLQSGESLKPAEYRHALPGTMRNFCVELSKHKFFSRCGFQNTRFAFEQIAAQMVVLESTGHATNVNNKVLADRYVSWEHYDFASEEGERLQRRVRENLNTLAGVFPKKTPLLSRYVVLSLYLLISSLSKGYKLGSVKPHIREWFEDFMVRLTTNRELPTDEQDAALTAFERASDFQVTIQERHDVLVRDFFMWFPNLQPLDPQRNFTPEQRLAIYKRANGMCQWVQEDGSLCGHRIGVNEWHADHITAWSKGGKTLVSNGRVLCPYRNQQTANKVDCSDECRFRDGRTSG